MKNNIQKATNPQLKVLTPEQLLSIKGGTGTDPEVELVDENETDVLTWN